MAKKPKNIKPKAAKMATVPKDQYDIVQIENVLPDEADRIIVTEQRTNPLFLYGQKIPEGDGEFTLILVYRRP
jgi:hypothetical protein